MSSGFLDPIIERKRREVAARKKAGLPGDLVVERDPGPTGAEAFESALRAPGVSVIAEIKRYSPSKPDIRKDLDPAEIATSFEKAGAAAVSVLTDGEGFGGSLDDVAEVVRATSLPVLRKDFTLDPFQIDEARAWGASAVLLIVAILEEPALRELIDAASKAGLQALVEVHTERELEVALGSGARIVGVNNRDLATFDVDLGTSLRLAPSIPEGVISVAESGISGPDEVRALGDVGYDAVLVGESVLIQPDVEEAVRILVEGGRRCRNRRE